MTFMNVPNRFRCIQTVTILVESDRLWRRNKLVISKELSKRITNNNTLFSTLVSPVQQQQK